MKRKRNSGFTLAEVLIVVGIIGVLAAVSFIAVSSYQRSMYQLEYDGIARELYFAAQNHLTMADSQGLVRNNPSSGEPADEYTSLLNNEKRDNVYYYAVPGDSGGVLALMRPALSADTNNSRGNGGSYFIVYQKSSATVLDVFYSARSGRFGHAMEKSKEEYSALMALRGDSQKAARRNAFDGAVIGYYGAEAGEGHAEEPVELPSPNLFVENKEQLRVEVTCPKKNRREENVENYIALNLIIRGETSGAVKTISLVKHDAAFNPSLLTETYVTDNSSATAFDYEIILDDITTQNGHFSQKFKDADENGKLFIPGENLLIQAECTSVNSIVKRNENSPEVRTNSLFADPPLQGLSNPNDRVYYSEVEKGLAAVAYFRHLENLDSTISELGKNGGTFAVSKAAQIAEMDWNTSKATLTVVTPVSGTASKSGCYLPVTPRKVVSGENTQYLLAYDGQGNSIKNVKADHTTDAGLFSAISKAGGNKNAEIKNLKLIDFDITNSSGNAGALVGTAADTDITNVLAYNSTGYTKNENIKASATGSAGGLIGSMTGGKVEKSAAALWVESSGGSAGGLIGSMSGGSVTASYAGGHTNKATYFTDSGDPIYNVTGATAGGLIGSMTGGSVSGSYSTCSASGTTAGGFVGSGSGTISNCYCTGLVKGTTTEGAFAGEFGGSISDPCWYFEIINERPDAVKGYTYLNAIGSGNTSGSITALDATAKAYDDFCGSPNSWNSAIPYDGTLKVYYNNKYNLKTIKQLDSSVTADFVVSTHYGDWPAPEAFVVNTGGSSGNPTH